MSSDPPTMSFTGSPGDSRVRANVITRIPNSVGSPWTTRRTMKRVISLHGVGRAGCDAPRPTLRSRLRLCPPLLYRSRGHRAVCPRPDALPLLDVEGDRVPCRQALV